MKPRNCNECKYHNSCNSHYGGLGCRYKITPLLVALAIVLTFVGTVASATTETTDTPVIIEAEDIGIKTIPDPIDTEPIIDDPEPVDEHTYTDTHEYEYTHADTDNPPPGMSEGYEEDVYYEVNTDDCELHEECFTCDEHVYDISVCYDEEINPDGGWVRFTCCTVCGHSSCEPIGEDEL